MQGGECQLSLASINVCATSRAQAFPGEYSPLPCSLVLCTSTSQHILIDFTIVLMHLFIHTFHYKQK